MDPVTLSLISAGVGGAVKVASDLFDPSGGQQANLMRQEAALKMSALEESMRRAEGAQTQVLSSTKARMAATGLDSGSATFSGFLKSMSDRFTEQNAFTQAQGTKAISMMDASADILANPAKKLLAGATDFLGTGFNIGKLLLGQGGGLGN